MNLNVFDELILLICLKRKEIGINLDSKYISKFIPKIYYIGDGKSGSTSIIHGFLKENVAHWHNLNYFEKIYDTTLLSDNNFDLYNLINYIGKRFKFKPTIIECTRNPINLGISRIFQHIKFKRNHDNCSLCKINILKNDNKIDEIIKIVKQTILKNELKMRPYSIEMFKKHFNIDLLKNFDKNINYYFNNQYSINLLFLKFENIEEWSNIINKHLPYKFNLKHRNKTEDILYDKVKKNLKFDKKEFDEILKVKHFNHLY